MQKCSKYRECGREAYMDGLCLPHLHGWKPGQDGSAFGSDAPKPPRKRSRARKSASSSSSTKPASPPSSPADPPASSSSSS